MLRSSALPGLSFCGGYISRLAPGAACTDNGRILLANYPAWPAFSDLSWLTQTQEGEFHEFANSIRAFFGEVCPKASAPLGCVSVATRACRKRACNTSRPPRQSILIVWRHGSMVADMPKRETHVLPRWQPKNSFGELGNSIRCYSQANSNSVMTSWPPKPWPRGASMP
jgi:hypothetical protein